MIYMLSCALVLGQATERAEWQLSPQLNPGLEVVYRGAYREEVLIPNVQYQREYRLETTMLVLDVKAKESNAAFMTALSLHDPRQPVDKKNDGPTSVRLELGAIDLQGGIRKNDGKPMSIPVQGLPTLECGFILPAPLGKVGRRYTWETAKPGWPVCFWEVVGTEACGGITCLKIFGIQQSDDWERPRADQTAWRRRDTIWLLPKLNIAQKVERIVERRDPAREAPTHRSTVRYEIDSRLNYPTSLFEDRRQELLTAKKLADDADLLARNPALYRAQVESLLQRVDTHLDGPTTTSYRKAFLHVKYALEKARKGEVPVPNPTEEMIAHTVQALQVGQRAPDFAISSLTHEEMSRLYGNLGKPVLVLFYNPATPTGMKVISFAKELSEKHAKTVAIMAMAVTADADIACRQHKDMRLPFPILDGNGMRQTFGADHTPRLVLLDGNGYVRFAQTGWGWQTPYEIQEELQRCEVKGER